MGFNTTPRGSLPSYLCKKERVQERAAAGGPPAIHGPMPREGGVEGAGMVGGSGVDVGVCGHGWATHIQESIDASAP